MVAGCVRLIMGDYDDVGLIVVLGGPSARWALEGGGLAERRYWIRSWGARGLLWAWEDSALDAIIAALGDEAWRVREMAAKVVARNLVGDALAAVAELRDDPVLRVRVAATRAVVCLTRAGA